MSTAPKRQSGPVLLCYDGSEPARQAIERASRVLGGGNAVVLTVWESVGSAILRHTPSEATELGREAKEISEDVVAELDASTEKRAQATAGEGAELAVAAGFRRSAARAACACPAGRARHGHRLACRPGRGGRRARRGDRAW
jgi:hypothetical protein